MRTAAASASAASVSAGGAGTRARRDRRIDASGRRVASSTPQTCGICHFIYFRKCCRSFSPMMLFTDTQNTVGKTFTAWNPRTEILQDDIRPRSNLLEIGEPLQGDHSFIHSYGCGAILIGRKYKPSVATYVHPRVRSVFIYQVPCLVVG
mmetsp:Transcript_11306/g.22337  ORF Transcript_11306/g.22337 Transcript_11306/m.22337 type:complete len:150 (+) Transcript_11306:943-1392(+)